MHFALFQIELEEISAIIEIEKSSVFMFENNRNLVDVCVTLFRKSFRDLT